MMMALGYLSAQNEKYSKSIYTPERKITGMKGHTQQCSTFEHPVDAVSK